jgi:serine/threonine-protein kinase
MQTCGAVNNLEMHELQEAEVGLGEYQFRRVLGEGGFGQVVEAWDPKLRRSIAIKRLKPALLSSRPDNLLDEARLAASLRHTAFVKIFSIDGNAEQQSIIMEFIEGATLGQSVREQPIDEARALDIVAQVAEAMEEAHAAQLIHGDLKPSNLMLDLSGRVRIMDFGLARKIDPQATEVALPEETTGTIAYLAPELLIGSPPNEQSDVYSLGVVLYEMLNGARPFAHLNGLALAAAHIQSSSDLWPFPPGVSLTAQTLVRSMTARDLNVRLRSMSQVRAAALATKGSETLNNTRLPLGKNIVWTRPRRVAALSAVALAVAFVVGAFAVSSDIGHRYSPFFSEATAMQRGLEALRTFDRDESLDLAITEFKHILERRPDNAAAAAGLAMSYALRHAGDKRDPTWLQRADASAQMALRLNDQLALAYAAQGNVRNQQGRSLEAVQLTEKALRLEPLNVFALELRVKALRAVGRIEESREAAAAAVRLHPRDRFLADAQGLAYFQAANYTAAAAAFRRSIAIEPDAVLAYANLSAALLYLDRSDEALGVLQQGLQIRPSGQLYSNLGNLLFNRGDYVGAAEAFQHAVSSTKGNSGMYLRWANLGDTLRWIPGRENEARNAYLEAIQRMQPELDREPNDSTLLSRMALYMARTGDTATAIKLSTRAIGASPDQRDIRFRAAMVFELGGNRAEALVQIIRARTLGYPVNLINAEPDLVELRRDPLFHQPTPEGVK